MTVSIWFFFSENLLQKRQEEVSTLCSHIADLHSNITSHTEELTSCQERQLNNTTTWADQIKTNTTSKKVLRLTILKYLVKFPNAEIWKVQCLLKFTFLMLIQ